ncbi:TetR/AcrR family transcriptional regulator [Micrococcales bacterium 31B]|nr:TetR/AcrR family transcriptional regulator [Micrococcales bacterium 31B]
MKTETNPEFVTHDFFTSGYAKGKSRKLEIIEKATAVFGEVGYHGSSLRDIGARVGISHAGLLHHFGSKEGLLTAVLVYRDWLSSEAAKASGEHHATDPFLGLVATAERNMEQGALVELFAVLAAEASNHDHPAHDFFVARYATLRRDVTAACQALHEQTRLRPGVDPEWLATAIIALMDGLQVQWLLDPESVDMGAATRTFVNAFLADPL